MDLSLSENVLHDFCLCIPVVDATECCIFSFSVFSKKTPVIKTKNTWSLSAVHLTTGVSQTKFLPIFLISLAQNERNDIEGLPFSLRCSVISLLIIGKSVDTL